MSRRPQGRFYGPDLEVMYFSSIYILLARMQSHDPNYNAGLSVAKEENTDGS